MKIPILAAFALLALVKAHDVNDERRHHSAERHLIHEVIDVHHVPDPIKEDPPGDNSDINDCGWKTFPWKGDCYQIRYCKDDEGNYVAVDLAGDNGKIDDKWCGIGEKRNNRRDKPSKCKKWKRKCRKCKRKNDNDRVSTCMHIFCTLIFPSTSF